MNYAEALNNLIKKAERERNAQELKTLTELKKITEERNAKK